MTPKLSIRADWADKFDHFAVPHESGCWIWQGGIDVGGYGTMKIARRQWRAHRLSYLLHHGDLPQGSHICHTCDNPRCVNPDHLYAGDASTNMGDAVARGRAYSPRGEACGKSKLLATQVAEIRRLHATGRFTQADLGRAFSVHQAHISSIVRRKVWIDD